MTAPTFVALLDVIGYKDKINADRQSGDEAFKNKLESSLAVFNGVNEAEFNYQAISDTLIISTHPTAPFCELLRTLKRVHKSFLANGLFLRGGVAFAPHFRSGNLTYSHALPVAYQLEQKQAVYPRIVIDNNILELFALGGKLEAERVDVEAENLICAQNGIYFVNVAQDDAAQYYQLARSIYENERDTLSGKEHELAKHRWLQDYIIQISNPRPDPYIEGIKIYIPS